MFAQTKSSAGPRRTGYNRPVPTRLRMGLVMRRDIAFGEFGDVEGALRAEGVGLAPISTGDASLIAGGVTVLATATAKDIAEGPDSVKNGMEIVPVARMGRVLEHALIRRPEPIEWDEAAEAAAAAAKPPVPADGPSAAAH